MSDSIDDFDFADDPPADPPLHLVPPEIEPPVVWEHSSDPGQNGFALYETAANATNGHARPELFSMTAERNVISCCALDGADVIRRCLQAGLSPASFYFAAHGVIFRCLLRLYERNAALIDASLLYEELLKTGELDAAGGQPVLTEATAPMPTTIQAGYYIEQVHRYAVMRAFVRTAGSLVEECYNHSGDITEFAASAEAAIAQVVRTAREAKAVGVLTPLLDYHYPETDDPGILLGSDDYLGRGGGMLFVSYAGIGKSSLIMDACLQWALGRPWMGLRSNGPLRCLIIQSEDSARYLGKVADSFAFFEELTAAEIEQVRRNCVTIQLRGISGAEFFAELRRLLDIYNPDLLVINPLYLFAEGDIAKSEDIQPFLRQLDALNPMRFGTILVHHTGKPAAKGNNGKRAELENWETTYMGFGSSYLANWPRCSCMLMPKAGSGSRFALKLGKGAPNAGITRQVPQGAGYRLESVNHINIRYSSRQVLVNGVGKKSYYWELDEDQSEESVEDKAQVEGAKKRKRRTDYPAISFRDVFMRVCPSFEKRESFSAIRKEAVEKKGEQVKGGVFVRVMREAIDEGLLIKYPDDGMYYCSPFLIGELPLPPPESS